ncbi:ANTAR domain-containing protein [Streptomyces sp. NPDC050504]|uniref:ANTAR domain-containing protein n=1 Tax=Streptomyces sp. NPDC050504 TaxID=3365618 RepID=UPI003798E860
MSAAHGTSGKSTAERVKELENEVLQLKKALLSRAVIDQAVGIVVATGAMPPDEAWDVLRETSMRTNTKLRVLAEQLVAWAHHSRDLDPALHQELNRRLAPRHRDTTHGEPPA